MPKGRPKNLSGLFDQIKILIRERLRAARPGAVQDFFDAQAGFMHGALDPIGVEADLGLGNVFVGIVGNAIARVNQEAGGFAGIDVFPGQRVDGEEGDQSPATRPQDPVDLIQIVAHVAGEHVGEHRCGEGEVEKAVLVGEAESGGLELALFVVVLVVEIHEPEVEVGVLFGKVPMAPGHAATVDIEAPIAALRLQVVRKGNRHATHARTDVQNSLSRLHLADVRTGEVAEEFTGDGQKAFAAHKIEPPRGQLRVAPSCQPILGVQQAMVGIFQGLFQRDRQAILDFLLQAHGKKGVSG